VTDEPGKPSKRATCRWPVSISVWQNTGNRSSSRSSNIAHSLRARS